MSINKRIAELRKALKLNQQQFANELGKTRVTVAYWENGRNVPPNSALLLISEKYDVNYEWINKGVGSMFKHSTDENVQSRIKQLRKELKLSQTEFGNEIGITQITISNWESGKYELTYKSALLICHRFNISVDWLMNGIGEMRGNNNSNDILNYFSKYDMLAIYKWSQLSFEEQVMFYPQIKSYIKENNLKTSTE